MRIASYLASCAWRRDLPIIMVCSCLFACESANDSDTLKRDSVVESAFLANETLPPGVEKISFGPQFLPAFGQHDLGDEGDQILTLVAPIPLPTSNGHRVEVIVRLPAPQEDGSVSTIALAGALSQIVQPPAVQPPTVQPPTVQPPTVQPPTLQSPTLTFPVGTWLARVESVPLKNGQYSIADIRGVQFQANREMFFVARPARPGVHTNLVGLGWTRDDLKAERAAHKRLTLEMNRTNFGFIVRPSEQSLAKRASHFARIGRCSDCHVRARDDFYRPDSTTTRAGFFPRRGTDANGYYSLRSLFRMKQPRENYGKSLGDSGAFFRRECASGDTCEAPSVTFDLQAAIAAGDAHAKRVCQTRHALHAAIAPDDVTSRRLLEKSIALCQ